MLKFCAKAVSFPVYMLLTVEQKSNAHSEMLQLHDTYSFPACTSNMQCASQGRRPHCSLCHAYPATVAMLQVDVLECFLDAFYDATDKEGSLLFSKSDQKKTLLLMHILMVGLILQDYNMGPRLCEHLRQAVKLTVGQFTSMYRYSSGHPA